MFFYDWHQLPFLLLSLAIAFSVHEFAHAFAAYKFGDPTAKNQGRLTLSPLAHLDVIGTIMILIAGFGWARPVPVNRFYFKKPRLAGFTVSVVGPLSNLLLASLGLFIWYSMIGTGLTEQMPPQLSDSFYQFFNVFVFLNVVLFIFNLLPFPPLDGYRMIEDLAPSDVRAKLTQYEQYGILIFLILVLTPLDNYTIQPIFDTLIPVVMDWLDGVFAPLTM